MIGAFPTCYLGGSLWHLKLIVAKSYADTELASSNVNLFICPHVSHELKIHRNVLRIQAPVSCFSETADKLGKV